MIAMTTSSSMSVKPLFISKQSQFSYGTNNRRRQIKTKRRPKASHLEWVKNLPGGLVRRSRRVEAFAYELGQLIDGIRLGEKVSVFEERSIGASHPGTVTA